MSQAARLNLRMQKELKLLISDPPMGASFPHLSAAATNLASGTDQSSPPLFNIDAEIQGPDGTAYSGGVFKLKIQIPERYPFQPPNVTFATPIYHPNIDNGGRICLDILNVPPKGAWQPSLNISTVITGITLLLTEPNPDDGLMCEASKEYKYNRQAFDLKAKAITEKYAKPGPEGNSSSSKNHPKRKLSVMDGHEGVDKENEEPKCAVNSCEQLKPNKQLFMHRKLSLEASRLALMEGDCGHGCTTRAAEHYPPGANGKSSLSAEVENVHQEISEKTGIRRKLSLHTQSQTMERNGRGESNKENVSQSCSHRSGKAKQSDDQHIQFNQRGNVLSPNNSKLSLSGRKLSLNRSDV